jgi:SAM-dependent methyltransferase
MYSKGRSFESLSPLLTKRGFKSSQYNEVFLAFLRHIRNSSLSVACPWILFFAKSFVFTSFAKIMEFRVALKCLGLQEGEKVCDLGCGYGENDLLLSLTGAKVYGVDIDRAALLMAKNNSRRLGAHVSFCVSDLSMGLGLKSCSFDKAVSYCVLEHLDDPKRFLNEANRILRQHGTLVLSIDSFSYKSVSNHIVEVHKRVCDVKAYYTLEQAKALLRKCNFQVVDWSFLIKSRASSWLFEKLLYAYFQSELWGKSYPLKALKLISPISLVVSVVSDRLWGMREAGYWLVLVATKKA